MKGIFLVDATCCTSLPTMVIGCDQLKQDKYFNDLRLQKRSCSTNPRYLNFFNFRVASSLSFQEKLEIKTKTKYSHLKSNYTIRESKDYWPISMTQKIWPHFLSSSPHKQIFYERKKQNSKSNPNKWNPISKRKSKEKTMNSKPHQHQ